MVAEGIMPSKHPFQRHCLLVWLVLVIFTFSVTIAPCSTDSHYTAVKEITLLDEAGDVVISDLGGLPNVTANMIDLVALSIEVLNSSIKVTFNLSGPPISLENAGLGDDAVSFFAYSVIATGIIDGDMAQLIIEYDNLMENEKESVTITLTSIKTYYTVYGNISISNNTLLIEVPTPDNFEGICDGTVYASVLLQSRANSYSGMYDSLIETIAGKPLGSTTKAPKTRPLNTNFILWILAGVLFVGSVTLLGYKIMNR